MGREVGGALQREDCFEVRGDGGAQMDWRRCHRAGGLAGVPGWRAGGRSGLGCGERRRGDGDGFGEDFCVGAAQVVGVDGCGVVEGALLDAGEGERQGGCGGGFGDELRGKLGDGLGDGGLADDKELLRFPAGFGEELVAGLKGFAKAEAVGVEAGVELAAAGVEKGVDNPPTPPRQRSCQGPRIAMRLRWMGYPGGRLGEAGEDGEAGDGDEREVEGVAEALGSAEADALSGEGARAVDDGYGVQLCKAEAEAGHQRLNGWDEALGGGTAGEGQGGGRGGCVGQGDAAGCATGVDEQNLQIGAASGGGLGWVR